MTVSQSLYTSIDPEKNLPAIPSSDSATGWAHNLFSNKEDARNQKVKTTIAQQNLPLEILSFLGSYASNIHTEKRIEGGLTHAFHSELRRLNEALGKCEMLMQPSMPVRITDNSFLVLHFVQAVANGTTVDLPRHNIPNPMAIPPPTALPARRNNGMDHYPRSVINLLPPQSPILKDQ